MSAFFMPDIQAYYVLLLCKLSCKICVYNNHIYAQAAFHVEKIHYLHTTINNLRFMG